MLYAALGVLLLTGFYPLWRAWRANRATTLRQSVGWAGCAWLAWVAAAWVGAAWPGVDMRLSHYVALCLTGCAGAAVLGARRPGAGAWNFVVASLLVVLLWPVAEGLGDPRLNVFNATFLSAALAVGVLNYLPTRTAAAVLPAGAACVVEFCVVLKWIDPAGWDSFALALLAVAPWLGLATRRRRKPATAFDREWLAFRDRFGAVWGLPARDQVNRAAANAGWGVVLEWRGLRTTAGNPAAPHAEALAGLRGVLKRFGPEGSPP